VVQQVRGDVFCRQWYARDLPNEWQHSKTGSGNYTLTQNQFPPASQSNWRWCHKCQGLFFAGNATTGKCPAGGGHQNVGSGNYSLPHKAA